MGPFGPKYLKTAWLGLVPRPAAGFLSSGWVSVWAVPRPPHSELRGLTVTSGLQWILLVQRENTTPRVQGQQASVAWIHAPNPRCPWPQSLQQRCTLYTQKAVRPPQCYHAHSLRHAVGAGYAMAAGWQMRDAYCTVRAERPRATPPHGPAELAVRSGVVSTPLWQRSPR